MLSQSLKSSEAEYEIRKTFGVGVESESEIRDFAYLWYRAEMSGLCFSRL